jgi:putative IMPACT (imprinted ancient) family translation regulator
VLAECEIVERTVDVVVEVSFSYIAMNDVMRIVKDMQPRILEQLFDNLCTMRLSIRESDSQQLIQRLEKVEGATVDVID